MRFLVVNHTNDPSVFPVELKHDIEDAITNCDILFRRGKIPLIRETLHKSLMNKGWSDVVYIDASSKISITSVKSRIGLCIQTGNAGRMYADLLKLQALFSKNIILAGVYILPTRDAARCMGDNIAHYERLIRELTIFKDVINLPLISYGFYDKRSE